MGEKTDKKKKTQFDHEWFARIDSAHLRSETLRLQLEGRKGRDGDLKIDYT